MTTISDVAKRAGVSAMTVSRVVNNSGPIGADTRRRVEDAIEELGYVPNALGRQLRSKRTKMLGLVLSDITNPYFTTIARGVEDAAHAAGFSVVFCNTDESEADEEQYIRTLVERQVDGILLVPASSSTSTLPLLARRRIPVVILDRRVSGQDLDSVGSDSVAGAMTATRHLLELGHRRIAVLSGRREVSTSLDRVVGCRRALVEAGTTLDERYVRYGDLNYGDGNGADGYRMAHEVLALDPRPTAIVAANNFIAFGALRAIREAGVRVPEELSLVAFDDLPSEWVLEPFLTVISQPAYEIGQVAARLMLDHLGATASLAPRTVLLPSELVIRRSTGPAPRSDEPRRSVPGSAQGHTPGHAPIAAGATGRPGER